MCNNNISIISHPIVVRPSRFCSLAQSPRTRFSAASALVDVAGPFTHHLRCLLCLMILFLFISSLIGILPKSRISAPVMLQLQFQHLYLLSSYLMDLLGEFVSPSFFSQRFISEEESSKSICASLEKSELSSSRSGPSPMAQTVCTHRISLMARVSLGPSVAPIPVSSSTAHDVSQSCLVAPLAFLRSVLFINLPNSILKMSCSIMTGSGRHVRVVVISLGWICHYQSRNLLNLEVFLLSDEKLSLKLLGLMLHSIHSLRDSGHHFAQLGVHSSSNNFFKFKLNHSASYLLGDAYQHSRTILEKPPRYVQSNLISSPLKSDIHCLGLNGRGLHSSLALLSFFWPCDYFWQLLQTIEKPSL